MPVQVRPLVPLLDGVIQTDASRFFCVCTAHLKNIFNEEHAHGVRNLVINPALLSKIQ